MNILPHENGQRGGVDSAKQHKLAHQAHFRHIAHIQSIDEVRKYEISDFQQLLWYTNSRTTDKVRAPPQHAAATRRQAVVDRPYGVQVDGCKQEPEETVPDEAAPYVKGEVPVVSKQVWVHVGVVDERVGDAAHAHEGERPLVTYERCEAT